MAKIFDQFRMTIDIGIIKHKKLKHLAIEKGKTVRELVLEAIDKVYFTREKKDIKE